MSTDATAASATPRLSGRLGIVSWCLFDWAISAYHTIIVTFIFAAYFIGAVAEDPIAGTVQWGYASMTAALIIAALGPILGAIADQGGRRKPWLAVFLAVGVMLTALLAATRPTPEDALFAVVIFAMATVAMELGQAFYNSMLPTIAPRPWLGRISGWGWGLGYAGGLACLITALFGFVQSGAPWLGLDTGEEHLEHIRATAIMASVWIAVFCLPMFLLTPDRPGTGLAPAEAVRRGLATLLQTIRQIRQHGTIARFLIAFLFYSNGLATLFAFGGAYATGTFGLTLTQVTYFAIALNVSAGLGAVAFAWADDRIGPKLTVALALVGLIVTGTILALTDSLTVFWVLGFVLGVFIGPAQAASRSYMARLVPKHMETEMFGLYAFSGKATAFAGPLLFTAATQAFDSQRAGVASILAFLIVGLVLLYFVPKPER